jgi:enoyl-CoA hydratase/carnithine racemase
VATRSNAAFSPTALALIKRQLYELDGRSFANGIRLGADVNALARATPDFRAAVQAFLER